MSRREDIETAFWSDPDVLELSGIARAVYVWAFTNQRCGMAGVYKVAKASMQLETGWTNDDLDAALAELQAGRFLFYDGRVMWVRSRVKRLRTKSPSIAKAIQNDLEAIGEHPTLDAFREEYGATEWVWKDAPQSLRNPHADPPTTHIHPQEAPNGGPPDPLAGSQGKGTGKGTGKGSRGGGAGGGEEGKLVTFDKRPVPKPRLEAAEHLLHAFNARAGTDYGAYTGDGKPSESLRRIIGALTRHPNVSVQQWEAAIRWRFEHAFWDGVPDTGVVFGPRVDSANLASAMQEPQRRADLTAKLVGS